MNMVKDDEKLDPELAELREFIEQKLIPWMAAEGSRCLITQGDNQLVSYQLEFYWTESKNLTRKAS